MNNKKQMVLFLSLVTSLKDYVEVLHKLVETNSTNGISSYYDFGAILTFFTLSFKDTFLNLLSFKWLQDIWSIPTLIPDIASSMVSEISIFDGIFQNTFLFLEKPLSYGNSSLVVYCLEKFVIGFLNSGFLCLTTSTSTLITLRRFVMQGLEAGYIAGLGSIAGNIVWIGSIVFGLRFVVIPWLSLDILRYILGFVLLVKYMWDSYSERRTVLRDLSKTKIFALNFLLAFTEQTTIFPFLSNLSMGSDSTLLENFPTNSSFEFLFIHGFYLLGILLGSLSFLQFTCWFWENPAYNFYMWTISSFKVTTSVYSKFLNFVFLYLTMLCTMNSIGYFGLDYTVTNPLGFVHEDRLIEQKVFLETSFLNSKASDRNTRRNRGRHGRRERWKRRVRSYRTFDASLYDQGVYDLFPIEDLNYGFDRFWLRRKIRNHRVRFRFFPGPWMRSLKKQFARPRLESFMGPRVEFFRILFEQAYHPEFHEFKSSPPVKQVLSLNSAGSPSSQQNLKSFERNFNSIYSLSQTRTSYNNKDYSSNIGSTSFLRKFLRKVDNRMKLNQIKTLWNAPTFADPSLNSTEKLSSSFLTKSFPLQKSNSLTEQNLFENFYKTLFQKDFVKNTTEKNFSVRDQFMANYKTFLKTNTSAAPLTLLHPLKFYIQKDEAFRKKAKFYGVNQYRSYNVENNAPYFRVMMKRFFYYYKPTLRWERTMRVATMRKARRKGSRIPRKWNVNTEISTLANLDSSNLALPTPVTDGGRSLSNATHFYSLVSKRASRYRYQIYKDVLQHWYYSKMNRLLLKFDVDSFIRRQPKNHFLTKNEETNLHMKRFLLLDYSNSLRWYNSMQHYNTMKSSIGTTKSLANRAYNQQFYGTFKKIRHLFSITPAFNQNVLKFDQLLYNEFPNTSNEKIVSDSFLHEELKTMDWATPPNDIIDSAKTEIQQSLKEKTLENQKTIGTFLEDKNYNNLTKFLFNQNYKQESYPFNPISIKESHTTSERPLASNSTEDLWFALLKKCQNKLYDQKALKNYILTKVEKNLLSTQKKEKTLSSRLEKLKNWWHLYGYGTASPTISSQIEFSSTVEKAMKEALNSKTKIRSIKAARISVLKKDSLIPKILLKDTKENLKKKFLNSNPSATQIGAGYAASLTKFLKVFPDTGKSSLNKDNWRQMEKVLSKRKKIRKTFKRLKNVQNYSLDNESFSTKLTNFNKDFETKKKLDNSLTDTIWTKTKQNWQTYKEKKNSIEWKKRRSRLRRYRFFKGRGPIKKRTLGEKLKGRFRFLKKYGLINEETNLKDFSSNKDLSKTYNAIFQTLTKNSRLTEKNSFDRFTTRPMKQSRTLIKKHRYWKKHKKPIFAQNKRKIRKRRRYLKAKIRVLTKKFKTVEFQLFIKRWWSETFLPELLKTQQEFTYGKVSEQSSLTKNFILNYWNGVRPSNPIQKTILEASKEKQPFETITANSAGYSGEGSVVHQLIQNIYSPQTSLKETSLVDNLNSVPFYAGWDENLRKFVVTNRLLSRKTAGYSTEKMSESPSGFLNSMNAATTLYWQIPFTTYDPDQFFALGMDGFSPIGWKNFTFKFSQKTTKPLLVKKMSTLNSFGKGSKNFNIKILQNLFLNLNKENKVNYERFNQIHLSKRIQKRYKRVKKHPRPPVWFPSGPLSSQILPVHYIYVFYKRYRLPRDRYVRRRLRVNKKDSFDSLKNINNHLEFYNYTLRKRVKPKRKYHRKNFKFLRKNENLVNTIFRRQFRGFVNEKIRFRPSSSFIFKESNLIEKIKPRKKSENKSKLSNKSSRDNLRLRQLRRRVQRQVFRPVWRYKPQAGGFVWPGDYLRLDPIKAPKLNSVGTQELSLGTNQKDIETSKRKIRKKKRRIIPEWQIQPKKYLLQKHNKKVLKKRLEKSQNKIY